MCAVLGGIDTLVFTGGIGEHAAFVRQAICDGLEDFGIVLDPLRNRRDSAIISAERAGAVVRVMHSDENLAIARHVVRLRHRDH